MFLLRCCLLLFCLTLKIYGQVSLLKTPQRFRFSLETVSMEKEADLGFVGMGLDVFGLVTNNRHLYVGLHTFSAVTGKRPGLITLGMGIGYRFCPLSTDKIYLDTGMFIGGGGGGGAPDGGGFILRPHIAIEGIYKNIALQAGFSKIVFPSGEIASHQLFVGCNFHTDTYLQKPYQKKTILSKTNNPLYRKFSLVIEGITYLNFKKGSISKPYVENRRAQLIGIHFKRDLNKYLYATARLNGAFGGGIDGYMSVLAGLGYQINPLKRIKISPCIFIGASGGGGVESAGGATMQIELNSEINLFNNYFLKLIGGKTWAPWGAFQVTHLGIGLGKTFEAVKGFRKDLESGGNPSNEFIVSENILQKHSFGISASNRTYFSPNKKDKNKKDYLPVFQLLGFELSKKISKRWGISGATFWAYQGDYGAYAEGLLGFTYYPYIDLKNKLFLQFFWGAAGGGGIDVGEGLLFQYALGFERKINHRWSLFVKACKVQPVGGNFTPYSLDFGLQISINKLFKK